MKWPFVTRKVHELEVERLNDQVEAMLAAGNEQAKQAQYWRQRAERLTDAALSRAGAIHEPTMVEKKPEPKNIASTVAAAMAMKEFESAPTPNVQ